VHAHAPRRPAYTLYVEPILFITGKYRNKNSAFSFKETRLHENMGLELLAKLLVGIHSCSQRSGSHVA